MATVKIAGNRKPFLHSGPVNRPAKPSSKNKLSFNTLLFGSPLLESKKIPEALLMTYRRPPYPVPLYKVTPKKPKDVEVTIGAKAWESKKIPEALLMTYRRPPYPSPVMSTCFAKFHPNLVVGGTYSGQKVLWDNRINKRTPVQRTPLSASAHTNMEDQQRQRDRERRLRIKRSSKSRSRSRSRGSRRRSGSYSDHQSTPGSFSGSQPGSSYNASQSTAGSSYNGNQFTSRDNQPSSSSFRDSQPAPCSYRDSQSAPSSFQRDSQTGLTSTSNQTQSGSLAEMTDLFSKLRLNTTSQFEGTSTTSAASLKLTTSGTTPTASSSVITTMASSTRTKVSSVQKQTRYD